MEEEIAEELCNSTQIYNTEKAPIPTLLELSAKAHLDDIGWPNSITWKEIAKYEWHFHEADLPVELVNFCVELAFSW